MREFQDDQGAVWVGTVAEEAGGDYKGRYFLTLRERDGDDEVELHDVRWNSERTAARTLATMSEVELRRRLRSAVGRSRARPTA